MKWVSCSSQCVWGVDSRGLVFMRVGTSVFNHSDCDVTMKWVSCSSQCVWGVDSRGLVFMRVGTSVFNHSDCDVMVAAWIPIDCPPGVVFEQITCGSSCVHVWALD